MPNHPSPLTPSDAERLAREGVRPVMEWRKNFVGNESLAHPALSEPMPSISDSVSRDNPTVSLVMSDGSHKINGWVGQRFPTRDAAKLYAESRLREATLPLHAPKIAALEARVAALRATLEYVAAESDEPRIADAAKNILRQEPLP